LVSVGMATTLCSNETLEKFWHDNRCRSVICDPGTHLQHGKLFLIVFPRDEIEKEHA